MPGEGNLVLRFLRRGVSASPHDAMDNLSSADDRFIAKEISRFEGDAFGEIGTAYFSYLSQAFSTGVSVLILVGFVSKAQPATNAPRKNTRAVHNRVSAYFNGKEGR